MTNYLLRLESMMRCLGLGLLLFLTGCARSPSSGFLAPPIDSERETAQKEINKLLGSPDLMLGDTREYYFGPGDILTITLLGRPDILGNNAKDPTQSGSREGLTITVTENPMITLPLVGAVKIHGKTSDQLQQELTQAYSRFTKDPLIIISIDKYYHNQVTVLGAVNTPGRHPWEYGDTVLDAIFKAGGVTYTSKGGLPPGRYMKIYREKVTRKDRTELPLSELIKRLSEKDRIVPRRELVVPIEEFILSGNLTYNIPVIPGDILYIPTAGAVAVEGRVRTPGVTFLGPSLHTLSSVLTERGGLRMGADSDVEVIRTTNGEQSSFFYDARDIMDRESEDFLLQDGDQIFVYTDPFRVPIEWISSIFSTTASAGVGATYSPIK